MNKRANYLYELVGKVVRKKLKTDKNGAAFYQLLVTIENYPQVKAINAFPSEKNIWQAIEQSDYYGKNYLFYCKNYMGQYSLINWKELTNHGSN